MHSLALAVSLHVLACGGASYQPDPMNLADAQRCSTVPCGGNGDQALSISLVSIGVLVGLAAIREIAGG